MLSPMNNLNFQTEFSITFSLISLTKVEFETPLLFEEYWVKQKHQYRCCIGIQKFLCFATILISNVVFLRKKLTLVFFEGFKQKIPRLKINSFCPCSGIFKDQKCQKMLSVLTCFIVESHKFQPYLLHFSAKMSIDSFSLETDYSFLENKDIDF